MVLQEAEGETSLSLEDDGRRSAARFVEEVRKVELRRGEIEYISNVSGKTASAEEVTDPRYWGAVERVCEVRRRDRRINEEARRDTARSRAWGFVIQNWSGKQRLERLMRR